jgi:hypothetical protein
MVNQAPRTKNQELGTAKPTWVFGSQFPVLLLLGLAAALCYAAALTRFPLLAIYARPIQNLEKLTNANPWTGLALAGAVLLLFGGYGVGALAILGARDLRLEPPIHEHAASRKSQFSMALIVIGFPLVFLALLALVYPTTSVDLYDYMFRGRMLVHYQANTFVQAPRDFKDDPLFWYVAWRRAVTAYGPLWEGMSWLTARLAGEAPRSAIGVAVGPAGTNSALNTVVSSAAQNAQLLRLMLAYKGLSALGFLGCGAAIWAVLRRTAPEWRWLGLYLWLWNPLALWESLAAGHNDAWMAMLIVLAVGLVTPRQADKQTDRSGDSRSLSACMASFLMLTLGGLIKFPALMFGPVLLSAALRRLPSWHARLRLVVAGGLACMAVVVLAYAPFWVGWDTLRNFGDRGTLFTSSWLAVLQAPISLSAVQAVIPTRDVLAWLAPGDHSEAASQGVAVSIGLGLLVLGVLWASWRAWRAPELVAAHVLWLLLWFLFLCNPWFQPWYLLWALALLALQPWRARLAWALGLFCCTAMLSYLAGVFLLPLLGWNGDGAEWNALTAALIYGPPLLALLWDRRLGPSGAIGRGRLLHGVTAREEGKVIGG